MTRTTEALHDLAATLAEQSERNFDYWEQAFRDPNTYTVIREVYVCDVCPPGEQDTAYFDAQTINGPWAYLCFHHWTIYGRYTGLGEGRGQALVVVEAQVIPVLVAQGLISPRNLRRLLASPLTDSPVNQD